MNVINLINCSIGNMTRVYIICSVLYFTFVVNSSFVNVSRSETGDIFKGLKCNSNDTKFEDGCKCGHNTTFYISELSSQQCWKNLTKASVTNSEQGKQNIYEGG